MTSTSITDERVIYRDPEGTETGERRSKRVSWGALFAGTVVAIASWILLYAIGLAVGLSSVDPQDTSSARAAGIGTGIWSVIAPLIALFVGGLVAARMAGILERKDGVLHGVVVWGLATVAGLLLVSMLVSNVVGSLFGMGSAAAQTTAQAAGGAGGGAMAALGLDANTMLQPVNQRIVAAGGEPVTATELQNAVEAAVPAMIASGSFNRDALLTAIANNTAMSRAEAEQVAGAVQTQFQQARGQTAETALVAVERTGKAFWGISAALALGLAAAALGGALGAVGRRKRREDEQERHVTVSRPATA